MIQYMTFPINMIFVLYQCYLFSLSSPALKSDISRQYTKQSDISRQYAMQSDISRQYTKQSDISSKLQR